MREKDCKLRLNPLNNNDNDNFFEHRATPQRRNGIYEPTRVKLEEAGS